MAYTVARVPATATENPTQATRGHRSERRSPRQIESCARQRLHYGHERRDAERADGDTDIGKRKSVVPDHHSPSTISVADMT
jgi:hypothetical protein